MNVFLLLWLKIKIYKYLCKLKKINFNLHLGGIQPEGVTSLASGIGINLLGFNASTAAHIFASWIISYPVYAFGSSEYFGELL